jgi:hypothetical protein
MSFPSTQEINLWFQNAHTSAIAAGGSVYVMEKRAEQEVVKYVLRHAYVTILEELHDLNYPNNSRISVRVTELLDKLHNMDNVNDIEEDDEFVDDYNNEDEDEDDYINEANLLPDEDEEKESSVEINEDLLREVTTALLKALIASK